ncbi:MAG: hypothetical protein LH614_09400 [Pyrinomonadaceae bacterium]|nr:hypothetical protein [Pyrinomonadaceae bacterium]
MPISKYEFQIYADYHQFYLEDENSPHETDKVWDLEGTAHNRMLGVGEGLIAVGTARYETVPVSVELHDSEPVLELEKYSRVNECSLQVKSDKMIISGCTEYPPDAARIPIEPATYRVRILYGNLETVKDDWEGEDFYVLQMWKTAEMREISILKP